MSGNRVAIEAGVLGDRDGTPVLLGTRCGACERWAFPHVDTCPWCGSDDTSESALSTTGRLWVWTAVTAPPPGYVGPTPYGFGVVELDDGLRVVTRLTEADPATLSFGQPMRLVYDTVDTDDDGNEVVSWAFAATTDR